MTSAYMFLQVASNANAGKVHDDLHAIPGVKSVHYVFGPIDIIMFVDAPNMAGLIDVIGKIRAVPGIASNDTRIVLG